MLFSSMLLLSSVFLSLANVGVRVRIFLLVFYMIMVRSNVHIVMNTGSFLYDRGQI